MIPSRSYLIQTLLLCCLFLLPSLSYATIPPVQEITSRSGITAWCIEDHYLPIVSIKLAFKYSGSAYDPENQRGLAVMAASLMDEGAGDMDALEFKEKLEEMATTIDFRTDRDYFTVSIKTLSEHVNETLKLLQIALTTPTFDEEAVARVRGQLVAAIKRQEKEPNAIASRKLMETMFANHPYSHPPYGTIESLNNITPDHLKEYTKTHLTLDRMVIGVAGDITPSDLSKKLSAYLGVLPKSGVGTTVLPEVVYPTTAQNISIEYPVPQTVIMFGLPAVLRNDPMFYPTYVTNYIIGGGGFESRLMKTVREENGLVYSIASGMDLSDKAGIIAGSAATSSNQAGATLSLLHDVLEEAKDQGLTETELQNAKQYLMGSFSLKLVTNSNLADFLITMQLDHLGIDFLAKRNDYIQAITLSQINHMVKLLINPERMITVIVGKKT